MPGFILICCILPSRLECVTSYFALTAFSSSPSESTNDQKNGLASRFSLVSSCDICGVNSWFNEVNGIFSSSSMEFPHPVQSNFAVLGSKVNSILHSLQN